jgi:hypothetical protein
MWCFSAKFRLARSPIKVSATLRSVAKEEVLCKRVAKGFHKFLTKEIEAQK